MIGKNPVGTNFNGVDTTASSPRGGSVVSNINMPLPALSSHSSSLSNNNSIWLVPGILPHDPPFSPSPSPTSSQITDPQPPPTKKDKNFLSLLTNLIRQSSPPKLLRMVRKPPVAEPNNYTDSYYENPAYGTKADVFSASASLATPQPTQQPISSPTNNNEDEIVDSGEENNDSSKKVPVPSDNEKEETAPKKEGAHGDDENKVRGNWGSHIEFVLSCVGYAVGLGNVWRFPYLCYKNGGGSFLLIYWILSLTVGLPIIFLELSLGQFTSQGPTGVWNYAPIVKGLGYSMCVISAIGAIYYNVILSWALYYLFASFRAELLWSVCDPAWADYRCEMPRVSCSAPYQFPATDGLCYSMEPFYAAGQRLPYLVSTFCKVIDSTIHTESYVPCYYLVDEIERNRTTVAGCWNERLALEHNRSPQFSTEQFYFREVLGQVGKVGSGYSAVHLGLPQKWLALCLLLAWILVFLCLLNGIKSSGKVVYFTALFPYVVLGVLIGRGVTLPGAYDGIMFFLTPKFERMQDPNVWYAAASQLFFSLSACWGGMMALSSYNKFHTNTLRDALIVTSADTLTSFVASFAIFSVIGYGSHILQKPVDEVADAGTGLAFILYPKIIDSLPGSVAFAIMFFFMLLLLGLDSEFNSIETIFTALLDKYPNLRNNLKKKAPAFAIFCTPFFLLGLPLVCPGGTQLLELIDDYGPGWPVFFIGIVETLSMAWIYGTPRFSKDMSAMMPWLLNGKIRAAVIPWILRIFWGIVTPAILIFILVFSWTNYEPRAKIGEEILGWCITVGVIIWVPFTAIWIVVKEARRQHSFWLGFKSALSSSKKWGPFLEAHRREVAAIHGDILTAVASVDNSLDCVIDDDNNKPKKGSNNNNNDNNSNVFSVNSYHSSNSGCGGDVNGTDVKNKAGAPTMMVSNSNISVFSYTPAPPMNTSTIVSPRSSPQSLQSHHQLRSPIAFRDMPYVSSSSKGSLSSRATAL